MRRRSTFKETYNVVFTDSGVVRIKSVKVPAGQGIVAAGEVVKRLHPSAEIMNVALKDVPIGVSPLTHYSNQLREQAYKLL